MADDRGRSPGISGDQYDLVEPLDQVLTKRLKTSPSALPANGFESEDAYRKMRRQLNDCEDALAFDFDCKGRAPPEERRANEILQLLKQLDARDVYGAAKPRKGYGGQEHPRFCGDHFLSNADLIEKTHVYNIAQKMPKGCHLHIHFNANLLPDVLINIGKTMPRMFISSDIPLVGDKNSYNFDRCKLQFNILSEARVQSVHGGRQSLFSPDYQPRRVMLFSEFCKDFAEHYRKACPDGADDGVISDGVVCQKGSPVTVDSWLYNKVVFQEAEAHNLLQTADGAWEQFNGRTQLMKGLFNYETAYKEYTRLCLIEFVNDNIQYAEIRPNFMATNQVWKDDGSSQIDNKGTIQLIIDQYNEFQLTHGREVLKGLKIIYCTPRSFDPDKVEKSLDECLQFKLDYPGWIAGFDLVGEESKGRPLKDFIPQFLAFKKKCKAAKVDIPFLFHCGETLDIGSSTDGNLVDALLLGSKRIGHGFALARHPYIMEQMKKRNICIEVCPISNEILGLTPRMNGHTMYSLLANNVHCTISTDNGTLFRSRLSHDFYQTMAGKADMTLHGWRQLIEWSIEHSCMEPEQRAEVYRDWVLMWDKFCKWINQEYGHLLDGASFT
ncbi:hypothetical protein B0T19DRAFT_440462 [Cercophora scortea]|uniref:Adenosine deaminase domain-containing protein n=1 Tax=Cercophora scortea TaxID=314031 RepID=A0AAE0IYN8_9PEZI|nr:hypothetical protein B0T19DRAFT_440462 [Cercophora scortea]